MMTMRRRSSSSSSRRDVKSVGERSGHTARPAGGGHKSAEPQRQRDRERERVWVDIAVREKQAAMLWRAGNSIRRAESVWSGGASDGHRGSHPPCALRSSAGHARRPAPASYHHAELNERAPLTHTDTQTDRDTDRQTDTGQRRSIAAAGPSLCVCVWRSPPPAASEALWRRHTHIHIRTYTYCTYIVQWLLYTMRRAAPVMLYTVYAVLPAAGYHHYHTHVSSLSLWGHANDVCGLYRLLLSAHWHT